MKSIHMILFIVLTVVFSLESDAHPTGISERDVRFASGGISLAGTLFLPDNPGRLVPAIAVTHGSGREGRTLRGYRWIGTTLAQEGFAVLIYDKRGVGDSEGEYVETPDLLIPAGDLVAAVDFLKAQKAIDTTAIGVLGASQGGWVGPLAATMTDDISFVISLSGPGVSVREQVLYQRGLELREQGFSEGSVGAIIDFANRLYPYLATGEGYDLLKPEYADAAKEPWFAFFTAQGFTGTLPPPEKLAGAEYDFFRNIDYDPAPTFENLNAPMLVVLGEEDRQVPAEESARRMKKVFEKSGNDDVTIRMLPGEGHNFWMMVDGSPEMRPAFRTVLFAWLERFR